MTNPYLGSIIEQHLNRRGLMQTAVLGAMDAPISSWSPGNQTLFLSVQYPGENGTVDKPASHWPDGGDSMPRASVIAVRRLDWGVVGS
jgi:hypothetical protein